MFQRITIIVAAQSRKKGKKHSKNKGCLHAFNLQELGSVISGNLEVPFFKERPFVQFPNETLPGQDVGTLQVNSLAMLVLIAQLE